MNELLQPALDVAEHDPNVVGVFLKGSRATGTADDESDWDLVLVRAEGEPSQAKEGQVDVIKTTLARLRAAPSWELPGARAHARAARQDG